MLVGTTAGIYLSSRKSSTWWPGKKGTATALLPLILVAHPAIYGALRRANSGRRLYLAISAHCLLITLDALSDS